MPWFFRFIRFAPDDGGAGGSGGGSMVNPGTGNMGGDSGSTADGSAGGNANHNQGEGQDGAGATVGEDLAKLDPFGDLKEYVDAENGLYLGKYKTLKDAFEGYKQLSGKVREKFPEAPEKPEDYSFTFTKESGLEGRSLTTEDPVWGAMAPIFKQANVSKEAAQIIVEGYLKHEMSQQPDLAAEKAKLGAEADNIIQDVNRFVDKNNNPALTRLALLAGQSAETLKEFHVLINGLGEQRVPSKIGDIQTAKTAAELDEEARQFKLKHKDTIDYSQVQQKQYYALLEAAQRAKKAQSR